ncbi:MAG: T9SS type A sorting domain-containing protein [Elusimicrobiota bacterium]
MVRLGVLLFMSPAVPYADAQPRQERIYELYASTSTPPAYKRALKDEIRRRELRRRVLEKRNSLGAQSLAPQGARASSAVPSAGADAAFRLGDIYCFPNPAKRQNPAFHIEVGVADKVDLRIYDLSGQQVHAAVLAGAPGVFDYGRGPRYAYEYPWNVAGVGSGVYVFAVTARKGSETIKKTGKCAVIR